MKINLRRAAALQNSINEALRGITLVTQVSLNEFEDAEAAIQNQHRQMETALQRRYELNLALYEIRRAVGEANHTAGINTRLAEIARMDRHIEDLATLAKTDARRSPEVIQGSLEKIRRTTSDRISLYDRITVDTPVLTAPEIEQYRRVVQENRRVRQALQDEVLGLNVTTEIELSDNAVCVLKQEGLI